MNEQRSRVRLLLMAAVGYLVVLGYASASWAAGSRHESWGSMAGPLTAGAASALAVVLVVETVAGWLYRRGQRREQQRRAATAQERCGKRWGHFAHYWNASPVARYWCDGERSEES